MFAKLKKKVEEQMSNSQQITPSNNKLISKITITSSIQTTISNPMHGHNTDIPKYTSYNNSLITISKLSNIQPILSTMAKSFTNELEDNISGSKNLKLSSNLSSKINSSVNSTKLSDPLSNIQTKRSSLSIDSNQNADVITPNSLSTLRSNESSNLPDDSAYSQINWKLDNSLKKSSNTELNLNSSQREVNVKNLENKSLKDENYRSLNFLILKDVNHFEVVNKKLPESEILKLKDYKIIDTLLNIEKEDDKVDFKLASFDNIKDLTRNNSVDVESENINLIDSAILKADNFYENNKSITTDIDQKDLIIKNSPRSTNNNLIEGENLKPTETLTKDVTNTMHLINNANNKHGIEIMDVTESNDIISNIFEADSTFIMNIGREIIDTANNKNIRDVSSLRNVSNSKESTNNENIRNISDVTSIKNALKEENEKVKKFQRLTDELNSERQKIKQLTIQHSNELYIYKMKLANIEEERETLSKLVQDQLVQISSLKKQVDEYKNSDVSAQKVKDELKNSLQELKDKNKIIKKQEQRISDLKKLLQSQGYLDKNAEQSLNKINTEPSLTKLITSAENNYIIEPMMKKLVSNFHNNGNNIYTESSTSNILCNSMQNSLHDYKISNSTYSDPQFISDQSCIGYSLKTLNSLTIYSNVNSVNKSSNLNDLTLDERRHSSHITEWQSKDCIKNMAFSNDYQITPSNNMVVGIKKNAIVTISSSPVALSYATFDDQMYTQPQNNHRLYNQSYTQAKTNKLDVQTNTKDHLSSLSNYPIYTHHNDYNVIPMNNNSLLLPSGSLEFQDMAISSVALVSSSVTLASSSVALASISVAPTFINDIKTVEFYNIQDLKLKNSMNDTINFSSNHITQFREHNETDSERKEINRFKNSHKMVKNGIKQDKNEVTINKKDDLNFLYLKHVILKFLLSRETEAQQLIRVVSMLLSFTEDEERMLCETLKWKSSWFKSKPNLPEKGQASIVLPTAPYL